MTPNHIFLIASAVVLAALLVSLWCWNTIRSRTNGTARSAAGAFTVCFALYSAGQALALAQGLDWVNGYWAVPSICYAVAAIIFAVGSFTQLKSVRSSS